MTEKNDVLHAAIMEVLREAIKELSGIRNDSIARNMTGDYISGIDRCIESLQNMLGLDPIEDDEDDDEIPPLPTNRRNAAGPFKIWMIQIKE